MVYPRAGLQCCTGVVGVILSPVVVEEVGAGDVVLQTSLLSQLTNDTLLVEPVTYTEFVYGGCYHEYH